MHAREVDALPLQAESATLLFRLERNVTPKGDIPSRRGNGGWGVLQFLLSNVFPAYSFEQSDK